MFLGSTLAKATDVDKDILSAIGVCFSGFLTIGDDPRACHNERVKSGWSNE